MSSGYMDDIMDCRTPIAPTALNLQQWLLHHSKKNQRDEVVWTIKAEELSYAWELKVRDRMEKQRKGRCGSRVSTKWGKKKRGSKE